MHTTVGLLSRHNSWTMLLFLGAAKVDVVTSWVLLGHQAILNCNADTLEEQLATVLWYRGTKGEPIFT